jgi:hypothetical protein
VPYHLCRRVAALCAKRMLEDEVEGIDEGLVRDLAERIRCQRLRTYLHRTAGRRWQADGRQGGQPRLMDNVDERMYSPRPVLARETGL